MDRYSLLQAISQEWGRITGKHYSFDSTPEMLREIKPPEYMLQLKGLDRLEKIREHLSHWADYEP